MRARAIIVDHGWRLPCYLGARADSAGTELASLAGPRRSELASDRRGRISGLDGAGMAPVLAPLTARNTREWPRQYGTQGDDPFRRAEAPSESRQSPRMPTEKRNALGGQVAFPPAAHRPAVEAVSRPDHADEPIDEPALDALENGERARAMASGALGHDRVFHRVLAIIAKKKARNGVADDGPSVSSARQGGSEHPSVSSPVPRERSVRWRT